MQSGLEVIESNCAHVSADSRGIAERQTADGSRRIVDARESSDRTVSQLETLCSGQSEPQCQGSDRSQRFEESMHRAWLDLHSSIGSQLAGLKALIETANRAQEGAATRMRELTESAKAQWAEFMQSFAPDACQIATDRSQADEAVSKLGELVARHSTAVEAQEKAADWVNEFHDKCDDMLRSMTAKFDDLAASVVQTRTGAIASRSELQALLENGRQTQQELDRRLRQIEESMARTVASLEGVVSGTIRLEGRLGALEKLIEVEAHH
jgi:chromosome segregation ATPase